ncbi:FeoA family protein [Magnetospirillum sp. UT-4]|uniref:FeoA family protein n=1 Tax=Magnetospirillum sp. UT-4 TaxID=2681467 RepID=UPI00137EAC81
MTSALQHPHPTTALRLGSLRKGATAEIVGLDDSAVASALQPGELERRLIEMGLVEGAHVEVLHEGFPKRDPIAVRVNDHTVALRRAEADAVLVLVLTTERRPR